MKGWCPRGYGCAGTLQIGVIVPEIMNSFPEKLPEKRTSKYDWDTWFDGKVRRFRHGVDFNIKPESFRMTLLQNARKRNVFIKTTKDGNDIIMQAFPEWNR